MTSSNSLALVLHFGPLFYGSLTKKRIIESLCFSFLIVWKIKIAHPQCLAWRLHFHLGHSPNDRDSRPGHGSLRTGGRRCSHRALAHRLGHGEDAPGAGGGGDAWWMWWGGVGMEVMVVGGFLYTLLRRSDIYMIYPGLSCVFRAIKSYVFVEQNEGFLGKNVSIVANRMFTNRIYMNPIDLILDFGAVKNSAPSTRCSNPPQRPCHAPRSQVPRRPEAAELAAAGPRVVAPHHRNGLELHMVGAEGLGDGDGDGVLGAGYQKYTKKWGMGVGGWGNMPKICQKWELPLWFKGSYRYGWLICRW